MSEYPFKVSHVKKSASKSYPHGCQYRIRVDCGIHAPDTPNLRPSDFAVLSERFPFDSVWCINNGVARFVINKVMKTNRVWMTNIKRKTLTIYAKDLSIIDMMADSSIADDIHKVIVIERNIGLKPNQIARKNPKYQYRYSMVPNRNMEDCANKLGQLIAATDDCNLSPALAVGVQSHLEGLYSGLPKRARVMVLKNYTTARDFIEFNEPETETLLHLYIPDMLGKRFEVVSS